MKFQQCDPSDYQKRFFARVACHVVTARSRRTENDSFRNRRPRSFASSRIRARNNKDPTKLAKTRRTEILYFGRARISSFRVQTLDANLREAGFVGSILLRLRHAPTLSKLSTLPRNFTRKKKREEPEESEPNRCGKRRRVCAQGIPPTFTGFVFRGTRANETKSARKSPVRELSRPRRCLVAVPVDLSVGASLATKSARTRSTPRRVQFTRTGWHKRENLDSREF